MEERASRGQIVHLVLGVVGLAFGVLAIVLSVYALWVTTERQGPEVIGFFTGPGFLFFGWSHLLDWYTNTSCEGWSSWDC